MPDPVKRGTTTLIHEPKFLWYDGYSVADKPTGISPTARIIRRSYTVLDPEDFGNPDLFQDQSAVDSFFRRTGTKISLRVCLSCREAYDPEVQYKNGHVCQYDEEEDSWGDPDYDARRESNSDS